MKYIQKQQEPRSLTQYRASADSNSITLFDDYKYKDALRDSLLKKQGYICCYCMQRIKGEVDSTGKLDTRIEHWAPQSKYNGAGGKSDLRLKYSNLLAACRGNEGQPVEKEHCDKSKGDQEITINPTSKLCETQIYYSATGAILAHNSTIQDELGRDDKNRGVLNFNSQTLKGNRNDALMAVMDLMKRQFPTGNWTRAFIQTLIDRASQRDRNGYHAEYFAYVVFHLQKRLPRAEP